MGVRGLQGFVGSTCPHICTVVNLRELADCHRRKHPGCPPTVVVDAMCCLRYWYTPESWVCGGQWREYFSALRDFVNAFTEAGIKLVFFFDGMVEQDKRDEWVKRRQKNSREVSRIFQYIKSRGEQPGRHMFFIPPGLAVFTRLALKALGQEAHCSLQEADYEVATRGLQDGCLGVLGEDTDYLIYNTCPYLSIRELCLDTLDTVMLCREQLCESLHLHVADLPLLACLLGNDIVPEGLFESFRYKCLSSYTSVKENLDRRGNTILAVADHIVRVLRLQQGEKRLEEMLPLGPDKALFYKGVASYVLPGQTSPWFLKKSRAVVTLHGQKLSTSPDTETKHMGPAVMLAAPMCADPGFKQVTINSHPEIKQQVTPFSDPEVKQEVTMVSDAEILKVAKAHHIQGESYLVYNIMSSGEIECSNTLEDELDQTLPSQAFVYRPVRQRVYALLLVDSSHDGAHGVAREPKEVKEWFVYAGNPLKHPDLVRPLPMSIPGGMPSLKTLWLTQEPSIQAQRFDVLLACFNLSFMKEDLQAIEGPLRALCCLLVFLFVQVDTLCLEDLQALISQALCLQGKSTAQLVDLQLDHINPRAVQLGSLFVRGLTTLVFVNSACGFPLDMSDFMPWNVFDGKLFHQKYLQCEKGHSVETLLEQDRFLLTQFHSLKSMVVKACLRENRHIRSRQHWSTPHTGQWAGQGSNYQLTSSSYGPPGHRQPWRDQGPGGTIPGADVPGLIRRPIPQPCGDVAGRARSWRAHSLGGSSSDAPKGGNAACGEPAPCPPSICSRQRADRCCLVLTRHLFAAESWSLWQQACVRSAPCSGRTPLQSWTPGPRVLTPARPSGAPGTSPPPCPSWPGLSLRALPLGFQLRAATSFCPGSVGPASRLRPRERAFQRAAGPLDARPGRRQQSPVGRAAPGAEHLCSRAVLHSWPAGNKRAIINRQRLPGGLGMGAAAPGDPQATLRGKLLGRRVLMRLLEVAAPSAPNGCSRQEAELRRSGERSQHRVGWKPCLSLLHLNVPCAHSSASRANASTVRGWGRVLHPPAQHANTIRNSAVPPPLTPTLMDRLLQE
ncbi:constitutive coactivator of peroxisome proliferator-activated receptor gamma [Rhynchocyon petersi]